MIYDAITSIIELYTTCDAQLFFNLFPNQNLMSFGRIQHSLFKSVCHLSIF